MLRTSAASCLRWPREIASRDRDPGAARLEEEASGTLRSLGVVHVPLPEFGD